jgi:hypothetical protein
VSPHRCPDPGEKASRKTLLPVAVENISLDFESLMRVELNRYAEEEGDDR